MAGVRRMRPDARKRNGCTCPRPRVRSQQRRARHQNQRGRPHNIGEAMTFNRPIIILESPYRHKDPAQIDVHLVYLRRCQRDSWAQGEHPLASHGYYPFFLDDSDPTERKEGMEAGYRMWKLANKIIFYTDYGMSPGMQAALDRATYLGLDITTRTIGPNP